MCDREEIGLMGKGGVCGGNSMIYYDDILNVNAYLYSKTKRSIGDARKLIKEYQELDMKYDKMLGQSDDMLRRARQLAAGLGLDDAKDRVKTGGRPNIDSAYTSCADVLQTVDVHEFAAEFANLREEAHVAGFTNTRPEDILSAEEMRGAQLFAEQLDICFEKETGLTAKDLAILSAAVAIRVISHFLFSHSMPKETSEKFGFMERQNSSNSKIKIQYRIMEDTIPFALPDNQYFAHNDILGFHPILGWLFGVMNIMTDTVTTKQMETFSIARTQRDGAVPQIDKRISTSSEFLFPIIRGCMHNKKSLIAAIIREAQMLGVTKASEKDVSYLLQYVDNIEIQNKRIMTAMQTVQKALASADIYLKKTVIDLSYAVLINQIITAIHGVQYDARRDGDVRMYAIRTNKIIVLSNSMAAMLNSVPAIIEEDFSKLDFAGIITTCLSLFQSMKFWIEVKSNYLVSEYKKEIDKQLFIIDTYLNAP